MDCENKTSISKLRKLRKQLCDKQNQWKEAFAIKDAVVSELKVLKEYACEPGSDKEEIVERIDKILIFIDPDRQIELEKHDG